MSWSKALAEIEDLTQQAKNKQRLDSFKTAQTIFKVEELILYSRSKSPAYETLVTNYQISFLESIYGEPEYLNPMDPSLITFAGIFLKGKYDPIANTKRFSVMKEDFLEALSDSQLITLKDNLRLACQRLNQNDAAAIMKVLNKNRVLIDEILMGRVEPVTKLNGLLD